MDGMQPPAQEPAATTAFGLVATGGLAWAIAAAMAGQGQPLSDRQFAALLQRLEATPPVADPALAPGLRQAQLLAFDRLLLDFGRSQPDARAFVARARRLLGAARRRRGAAPAAGLGIEAARVLRALVAPPPRDDTAARRQAVTAQQVETAVLRELAAGFQDKLPEDWEARFPPGFNAHFRAGIGDILPRWFELFGALLVQRARAVPGFGAALDALAPALPEGLPAPAPGLAAALDARFAAFAGALPAPGRWRRWGAIGAGAAALLAAGWFGFGLLQPRLEAAIESSIGDRLPYACDIREWSRRNLGRAPVADDQRVTVLVARLAGDADGRATAKAGGAFAGLSGFNALTTCREIDAAMPPAELGALLQERRADLLLTGTAEAPGGLRLQFRGLGDAPGEGRAPFRLAGPLLEPALNGELASGLQAAALAALPRGEGARLRAVLPLMRPSLVRLDRLLTVPPPGFDAATRRDLTAPVTRALQLLAEQTDDQAELVRVVDQWRWLIGRTDRAAAPLAWGTAQAALGEALLALGSYETRPERNAEAVAAYRAAIDSLSRDRAPLDWAAAQAGLGAALTAVAQQDPGTATLREAVGAYRAALAVLPRAQLPEAWGEAQTGFADALRALGEREPGTARLEHAVATARAALEALPRESVPLDWAKAQNSLGFALAQLGAREGGTALLEEAAAAYRAALAAWPADRQRFGWAMVQNNLGNVLIGLAEQESGTARLEQAVSAYRAALAAIPRDTAPQPWAGTQNNLGTALWLLGERDKRPQLQEEAVVAFEAALTERTPDRVPIFNASSRYNLALVRESLGTQGNRPQELERALVEAEAALAAFQRAGLTQQAALVVVLRDRLRGKLGR